MLLIDVVCVITAFGLFVRILVDMFRRKVWWGLLGLFALVPAYYFAIRHYTGNRKVIAPLFFLATLVPAIHLYSMAEEGERRVRPFLTEVASKLSLDCKFTGDFKMSSGKTSYFVLCNPNHINEIPAKDVVEMIANYRSAYVEPMIAIFDDKLAANPTTAIQVGIKSPMTMVACFELFEGKVTKSWATGPDQPCAK